VLDLPTNTVESFIGELGASLDTFK
jgi:hypothetical protein